MNPGSTISSVLTLPKIIGGVGKTLRIANQIIPLYKQAKPLIKNARTAFSILKEFQKSNQPKKLSNKLVESSSSKNNLKQNNEIIDYNNRPQFFV